MKQSRHDKVCHQGVRFKLDAKHKSNITKEDILKHVANINSDAINNITSIHKINRNIWMIFFNNTVRPLNSFQYKNDNS